MGIQIAGVERVVLRLQNLAASATAKLRATMSSVATDVSSYVKETKLSGQVLNVRSGRLRRSINGQVRDSADAVSALIGTNLVYAKVYEFGFQGTVNVPAHTRMQTMAFGRAMPAREVEVRAHPMRMNMPERSFLRTSLRETAPAELDRIRMAMHELIAEARA